LLLGPESGDSPPGALAQRRLSVTVVLVALTAGQSRQDDRVAEMPGMNHFMDERLECDPGAIKKYFSKYGIRRSFERIENDLLGRRNFL
jgi:hypothetical protein